MVIFDQNVAKMTIVPYVGLIRLLCLESVPIFTWNRLVKTSLPKHLITLHMYAFYLKIKFWSYFPQNVAKKTILTYVWSIRLLSLESAPICSRTSLPKHLIPLCLLFKNLWFYSYLAKTWPKWNFFRMWGVNKTALFGISTHFYME